MATTSLPHRTLICVPLTSEDPQHSIRTAIQASSAGADLVELRIDLLKHGHESNWRSIITQSPLPLIVTYRHPDDGGHAKCPENVRLQTLHEAETLDNVAFIDIELHAAMNYISKRDREKCKTKLIVSHHQFDRPLQEEELSSIYGKIVSTGADVVKIAMNSEGPDAVCDIFRLLQGASMPCIIIAMGFGGIATRILAQKYGALITFASLNQGMESAPGQITINELLSRYRFKTISPNTEVYAIIGNPIVHSMSPVLHNMAFEMMGVDARYVPVQMYGDGAGLLVRRLIQVGFKGMSVTIPAKVDSMEAMDYIEPAARQIEAINTVTTNNIYVAGFNTDWSAAMAAIAKVMDPSFKDDDENGDSSPKKFLEGKNVVCVGAGGTARAIIYGALHYGADSVLIVNRTLAKAEELVELIGDNRVSALSLEKFCRDGIGAMDVLANTTSVGMSPKTDASPVPSGILKPGMIVFDAVYNPLETKLLRMAKTSGCKTVSGLDMFVGQAARQLRHWFPLLHDRIPYDRMREVVIETLEGREIAGVKR